MLYGYIPVGLIVEEAAELRKSDPSRIRTARDGLDGAACRGDARISDVAARSFSITATICGSAQTTTASKMRSIIPGFVPAYIRPLFCEGKGPFRWVALSGDKEDIYKTDEAIMNLFPDNDHLARWLTMAQEKVEFQGLPARICWLGYGERAKAGLKLNEMVASAAS